MPFGEELFAGTGGRTVGMGFSVSDGNRQKFTGYERDSETGLDFAQARYNSSTQGRFTSPDSFFGSAVNPQTLNRYAYVANNPLKFTDPTGHEMYSATTHGPERGVRGDSTDHIFSEFMIPQCFPTRPRSFCRVSVLQIDGHFGQLNMTGVSDR